MLVYFARHGIEPTVAYRVGVRERNGSLVFPYQQPTGEPFERVRAIRNGSAKVMQPRGVPLCIWWPMGRRPNGRAVLLCEGEGDALAAMTGLWRRTGADLTRDYIVAAVPGTSFPVDRLRNELVAAEAAEVVLAFDADDAGHICTQAAGVSLRGSGIDVRTLRLPDGFDLADWLSGPGVASGMFVAALIGAEPFR